MYIKSETPTEKLYKMIISFVLMFKKYKPHISLFYQESLYLSAHHFESINRKRSRYKKMMDQVVNEGIENKEFRKELPVPITSMAIFGMINWTYTWYKEKGTYSLQDISSIFADFILNAVLTKDALENPKYSSFFIKPILL
jgi:TetR/AcrR family transcriptional regulator, cholesterol catabolism regulator